MATQAKSYLRNLFKKMRTAATHVLVLMLSDERRQKKPYALPVRYIPYCSLRDHVRDFTKDVKQHMTERGMTVVGTTTDGEFCSLRSRGKTRAIHVWQLIHDAKDSVRRNSKATLLKMLIAIDCKWLEYMNSFFKLQSSVYTIIFVRKLLYISLCSLQGVFMQL